MPVAVRWKNIPGKLINAEEPMVKVSIRNSAIPKPNPLRTASLKNVCSVSP